MKPSDRTPDPPTSAPADLPDDTCAECGRALAPGEGVRTQSGERFCQYCFEDLRRHLEQIEQVQSRDIFYPAAAVGALTGGALGAVVWWQFTVLTHIAFGLIAVLIAFAVAQGIKLATGGKRSAGLQAMAVTVSVLSWLAGIFLVNRSLILKSLASEGSAVVLPWIGGPQYLYRVIAANFGIMDVVFAAITFYEAWKLTRPLHLTRKS